MSADRPERALSHRAQPNRVIAVATMLMAVALIPWIVFLGLSLPPRYDAGHWRLLWIGYDVAEVGVLAFAAWAAWSRRQILGSTSLVAAILLFSDAWFDIVTSWGHRDQWVTLATGLGVEIPLGIFFLWLHRALVLRALRAFHDAAHDGLVTSRLLDAPFVEAVTAVRAEVSSPEDAAESAPGHEPRPHDEGE